MLEEPTYDGMPVEKATTIRLIFLNEEDKNIFLSMLADGMLNNIQIGASESEPLFEVEDVSVRIITN